MGTGPTADGQARAEADHTESDSADSASAELDGAELDSAEFDIVVAGSGAAGMTAALTAAHRGATVVVLEKTGSFGGSTARSAAGSGHRATPCCAAPGSPTPPSSRARTWRGWRGKTSPRSCGTRCSSTARRCWTSSWRRRRCGWPGCPATPTTTPRRRAGWRPGAASSRCRSTGPCSARELARLNRPYLPVPRGVAVTQADYRWLTLGPRHPRAVLASVKVAGRLARSRLLGQRMLSLGQALAAGLRAGLLAREVPVWLDSPADRPGGDGRPGHRGPGPAGRKAGADPGPARGADRHRRVRAQRAAAPGSTSRRRSAPTGRPARPATPATASWPASGSAPRPA